MPSGWSRRTGPDGGIAFHRGPFVVEARSTELERPGISVGSGWELRYRRLDEAACRHVVRRVTTREAALDALYGYMRRINRRGAPESAADLDTRRETTSGGGERPVVR